MNKRNNGLTQPLQFKVLLTGSHGFIGYHLRKKLSQKYKILFIDKKINKNLLYCNLNYDVDLVIHLAGYSGVRESFKNPFNYIINNIICSWRLFNKFKHTKILYASSSTVMEPFRNPYSFSKYIVEKIAPLNTVGMRFTTVYGPKAPKNMFIPLLLKNKLKYINKNYIRDFIHVDDLVSAIETIIKKKYSKPTINIGSGDIYKLNQLDKFFKKVIFKNGNMFEMKNNMLDIKELKKLKWKKKKTLTKFLIQNLKVS